MHVPIITLFHPLKLPGLGSGADRAGRAGQAAEDAVTTLAEDLDILERRHAQSVAQIRERARGEGVDVDIDVFLPRHAEEDFASRLRGSDDEVARDGGGRRQRRRSGASEREPWEEDARGSSRRDTGQVGRTVQGDESGGQRSSRAGEERPGWVGVGSDVLDSHETEKPKIKSKPKVIIKDWVD